jgi:metal-responsive CopG/Arc/MetJ family transcriptional regulator
MVRRGSDKTVTQRKTDGMVMKRVQLSIPDELAQRLAHRAIDEKRDMSKIVADALEAYLKRAPK